MQSETKVAQVKKAKWHTQVMIWQTAKTSPPPLNN